MAAKVMTAIIAPAQAVKGARLPVALGLGLGACASIGLWTGIIVGIRAVFS